MQQSFTQNDLVRFLYGEMDVQESIDCMEWISGNHEVLQEFELLAESKAMLGHCRMQPKVSSLHKVLAFSEREALKAH
jgi:hypothetical protein